MVQKSIAVLGDGAWGTAMAVYCGLQGHSVTLWCYDAAVFTAIQKERINHRYLPGVVLPKTVSVTLSLADAVENADIICQAIPVQHLRQTIRPLVHSHMTSRPLWVILSKGIEEGTGDLPYDIVAQELGDRANCVVLVGPTFAYALASQEPSGFVAASHNLKYAELVIEVMRSSSTFFTVSSDIIGISLCAALKNSAALGCGIVEGLGYGDNAQALFFWRIFHEIESIIIMRGGNKESLMSLAGLGDFAMTSWGSASKNKECGRLLGKGFSCQQALQTMNRCVEGVFTIKACADVVAKYGDRLPLMKALYDIVCHNKSAERLKEVLVSV